MSIEIIGEFGTFNSVFCPWNIGISFDRSTGEEIDRDGFKKWLRQNLDIRKLFFDSSRAIPNPELAHLGHMETNAYDWRV